MKYLVPCVWQMYGRVEVEADSAEEAIEIAERDKYDFALPEEGFYLEDSFEIDGEGIVMDEYGDICD